MKLKVMTFNLRVDVAADGINYFPNRADKILDTIRREAPDLIGFQEANDMHRAFLQQNICDVYTVLGCGREKNYRGEAVCIAYKKSLFELISFETFFLSSAPGVPGTTYKGSDQSHCPRLTVHACLSCNGLATPIHFLNTHLDHKGQTARLLGMMQILQKISECEGPIILTGDMNAYPDEAAIDVILKAQNGAFTDATANLTHTFHGFGRFDSGKKIDYIFTNAKAEPAYIVDDPHENGVYISDHYPVCALLDLGENPAI